MYANFMILVLAFLTSEFWFQNHPSIPNIGILMHANFPILVLSIPNFWNFIPANFQYLVPAFLTLEFSMHKLHIIGSNTPNIRILDFNTNPSIPKIGIECTQNFQYWFWHSQHWNWIHATSNTGSGIPNVGIEYTQTFQYWFRHSQNWNWIHASYPILHSQHWNLVYANFTVLVLAFPTLELCSQYQFQQSQFRKLVHMQFPILVPGFSI